MMTARGARRVMRAAIAAVAAVAAVALAGAACGPASQPPKGIPAFTVHYKMRITSDPIPSRARERTTFKVVIRDKATNTPIEGGEGILYGNVQTDPNVKVWDTFVAGKEPGTYYANVHYIIAGNWSMGLSFRRDSTQRLEEATWIQQVNNASSEVP